MASRYYFSAQGLKQLELEHLHARDKRYSDWSNTVYILSDGWLVSKMLKL